MARLPVNKTPKVYVGGAFMAIHRHVLEVLADAFPKVRQGFHPMFTPQVVLNTKRAEYEYLSEDWAFCARVKKYRLPLWVSMRPICSHWGDFGYTVMTGNTVAP